MRKVGLTIEDLASRAGYALSANGKLDLPAVQLTADKLASVVGEALGQWKPGDEPTEVTITGAGPVWAYLAIAHALHGRATRLVYASPNATIEIWNHGASR